MFTSLLAPLWGRKAGPGAPTQLGLGARDWATHPATLPAGERVYAVGDIHGCLNQFKNLLKNIEVDAQSFTGQITLVLLGDYIDRGPASRGVLDVLHSKPWPVAWQSIFLRGNHDQALLDFVENPTANSHWLAWGGDTVLAEYGVSLFSGSKRQELTEVAAQLKTALQAAGHLALLNATRLHYTCGDYLFVHAGVRPFLSLADQLPHDLLMIRDEFIGQPHGLPNRVVFGHTITPAPLNEPDRLGLDTGAFSGGPLTAAVLEGTTTRLIEARA